MLSELAPVHLRGRLLLGIILVGGMPGAIVVYALGIVYPWRILSWIGCGLAMASTLSSLCVVESPLWILRYRKDRALATANLRCIRSVDSDIHEEIEQYGGQAEKTDDLPKLSELCLPEARRPLLICIGILMCNNVNGIHPVGQFTGMILEVSEPSRLNLQASGN